MNCWTILGLTSGTEPREIKRRFAQLIKVHRPEDDPQTYQRLRDAYEQALSWEEEEISDDDPREVPPVTKDAEQATSERITLSIPRISSPYISSPQRESIAISSPLSWQRVLDDLFLANEKQPEEAETQLAYAVEQLSLLDLKSRLQFEDNLVLTLSRVFRPLLTLAAAEKFKWHLTSGNNNKAARIAVNDKCVLWQLLAAEIAPLFFADMAEIDEVENGERLNSIYQNYINDEENRPWFDAAVLVNIARCELSPAFLGFLIEQIGWSFKPDKNVRSWSLADRFHALAIIHRQGYEKLCAVISASDGVYYRSRTFAIYAIAAEKRHALSRYNLGVLYEQGEDVDRDDDRAFFWFSCAAKQDYANAQHALGACYRDGKGTAKDLQLAVFWFLKSAAQGYVYAEHDLGCIYSDEASGLQDYHQAFYWFRKAAQQGLSHSQNHLGGLYYNGKAGIRDYQQALTWFTLAAAQNDSAAQYNLGIFYRGELTGQVNYQLAYDYFLQSAMQGFAPAQNEVATMYHYGRVVEQNYQMAIDWYSKSAMQGDAIAQYNLGQLYCDSEVMSPDYAKAIYWLSQSAEQGNNDAQFVLGFMYFDHDDIPRNMQKSVFWLNAAAQENNVDAAIILGKIYFHGMDEIAQDYVAALFWCEKAAKLKHKDAQNIVALMYANGVGTDTNYIMAWAWITISATPHPKLDKNKIRHRLSVSELAQAEDIALEYIKRYQLR